MITQPLSTFVILNAENVSLFCCVPTASSHPTATMQEKKQITRLYKVGMCAKTTIYILHIVPIY